MAGLGGVDMAVVLEGFGELTNALVALLAWVAGMLLYFFSSILDMALHFSIAIDYTNQGAVAAVWTAVRDLINLSFLFILVYAGIGLILNLPNVKPQRLIVGVVIAALLVNYSLFITNFALDIGNSASVVIYNDLTRCDPSAVSGCPEDGFAPLNWRITDEFGIQRSYSSDGFDMSALINRDATGDLADPWVRARNNLIRVILLGVGVWAMFKVAMIFVSRIILLYVITMFSPIGILPGNFPLIGKYSKQWRETLIAQVFLPVIFLLLISVFFQVSAETVSILQREGIFNPRSAGEFFNPGFYLNFAILIGILILITRITVSGAGSFAKTISGYAAAGFGLLTGVAIGGTGFAARRVIGGLANRTMTNEALRTASESGNRGAQLTRQMANWTQQQSFNPMQNSQFQRAMKTMGMNPTLAPGYTKDSGKGGRIKEIKDRSEKLQTYWKDFSTQEQKNAGERLQNTDVIHPFSAARRDAGKKIASRAEIADEKEAREKRATEAIEKINNATTQTQVVTAVNNLQVSDLRTLPENFFDPRTTNRNGARIGAWIVDNLDTGDLNALKNSLKKPIRREIYSHVTSPTRTTLHAAVRRTVVAPGGGTTPWIDDPGNGYAP